jgi:hypothetical protein
MCVTAASGGSVLYDQCVPFAILKPKNRKKLMTRDLLRLRCKINKPRNASKRGGREVEPGAMRGAWELTWLGVGVLLFSRLRFFGPRQQKRKGAKKIPKTKNPLLLGRGNESGRGQRKCEPTRGAQLFFG